MSHPIGVVEFAVNLDGTPFRCDIVSDVVLVAIDIEPLDARESAHVRVMLDEMVLLHVDCTMLRHRLHIDTATPLGQLERVLIEYVSHVKPDEPTLVSGSLTFRGLP